MVYCNIWNTYLENETTIIKKKLCSSLRTMSKINSMSTFLQKREKGRMRVHHLNNVNHALQVLEHNNVSIASFIIAVTL